jgi:hypothetical protein
VFGAAMRMPAFRLTLWQSMFVVAAVSLSSAVFRVNIALGTVAACVLALAISRTLLILGSHEAEAGKATRSRWLRVAGSSLGISTAIIGSACFTFLFIYTDAEFLRRGGSAHPPPPELNVGGVLVGMPSGLLVGYLVRRRLWGSRPW